MPLRLSNIRMSVDEPELALPARLARALDVPAGDIERWRILRKSLDVRDKSAVAFVYACEVVVPGERRAIERSARRGGRGVEIAPYDEPAFEMPAPGGEPLPERPVIVGSGPAGTLAAYFLAEQGYRPLVLERGRAVRERIHDMRAFEAGSPHQPESNYLFGEGGAGTFSDGKLTCRSSGPDVRRILEVLAECKGRPSILYDYRPHLGSNRLPAVVKALRQKIEAAGGEFRFECRVEDFNIEDGRVRGLSTSSGFVPASVVVLAIGHSARDTYETLFARGVPMVAKPFQFGVRIEQPQAAVNRVQYGQEPLEERLGAADYSLVARGRTHVFTFCMCAGGQVMPSVSEPGYFATNGMSLSDRASPLANSGLMVTIEPEHFGSPHPLAGIALQRHYEQRAFAAGRSEYLCPISSPQDFLAGRVPNAKLPSSYQRGVVPADLRPLLPPLVERALVEGLPMLDRRWRGKFLEAATLVGPESRGSSPVRFPRDPQTLVSPGVEGLYPVGEGAGYAGGIISAALDGLRAAKSIVKRYAPLERP